MRTFLIGLASFCGGAVVSWANYLLLCQLLKAKGENGIHLALPVRMLTSAAYLLLLYCINKKTGLGAGALLVGGALGLTVMLFYFTNRLTRKMNRQGRE